MATVPCIATPGVARGSEIPALQAENGHPAFRLEHGPESIGTKTAWRVVLEYMSQRPTLPEPLMSASLPDPNALVFEAVAFAARAHRNQIRKDKETPYVSHVFRVCLVVRHVFGFDDPRMLAAALLHDTIEDTPTDYDDIQDRFGPEIARWVVALSQDMRLPSGEREQTYHRALAAADWQVKVCKLADVYDNLGDSRHLSPNGRRKTIAKSHAYLDILRPNLPEQALPALRLVEQRLAAMEAS